MEDTEKELTPGGTRNPPTAMRDGALAGHPSSTSGDRHSSAVGNLAAKMETETGSEKYGAGTSGAAKEEVLFLGCKASTGKDMRPFSFTFQSSGKNHQTAELKRRTTKPLSPLTSDSSEEEIPIKRRKAPSSSLDIRMDPDRILMKAMEDISIVEENRRRSGNLKGTISGSMKRHLASAAEAIKMARDKRKARVEDSADSTIAGLRFELQQMEARQKILERKNQLLEKEVEKLRKEDSLKKKRGQEKAAPRCRITEEVRIPREMAVNRRIEKMPMPPSNIETKVEGLVASVATLTKAITQIQKRMDSVLKPRDDGVELAAVPPPPPSFSTLTGARDGMSFTKVLSKREKRKERAEAKKKIEVVTGSRVTGKMPTKKRRVGPATSMNNNNVNNINGAECKGKAAKFAEALNKALPEAKVALPKKPGEFVLCGLDAGVTRDEIVRSMKGLVVGLESCDVRVVDIYPGKGRLGQVYVSAPLSAIKEIAKAGSISVGWSKAKIRPLTKRPLRCFRCQARGHVGAYCPSPVSREGLCHRCGGEGHYAAACRNKLCCSVCKDAGRTAVGHVLGSLSCPPVPPRKFVSAVLHEKTGVNSVVATESDDANNNVGMEVSECIPDCAPNGSSVELVEPLHSSIIMGSRRINILQVNLNHARRAQDLLSQRMAELRAGLAVVAEPWYVPEGDARWFVSQEGYPMAAILLGGGERTCSLVRRGLFFVAIKYHGGIVVSVYCPPSERINAFEKLLGELEGLVSGAGTRWVLVAGDFNARSAMWDPGKRGNLRGELLRG
ncbi:hypothetical protein M0802_015261 [Mischocyttarus mexicanus]|nr:hypothetical protein M0802_015261 [Mischocyttarus mexicanus]